MTEEAGTEEAPQAGGANWRFSKGTAEPLGVAAGVTEEAGTDEAPQAGGANWRFSKGIKHKVT